MGAPARAELLNELYAKEWSQFRNFLCPAMKHIRTEVEVSRKKRVYDKAATPFERLKASGKADPKRIDCLERVKTKINPVKLKKTIERKLRGVLRLQRTPGRAAASNRKSRSFKTALFQSPCELLPEGRFEAKFLALPGEPLESVQSPCQKLSQSTTWMC